ncbi:MAG: hypothetical protein QG655_3320 [Actinomycetota bacterium]|jgi:hypothetical protein|nr:hypothetical protein [Actinomycetota bacterium]
MRPLSVELERVELDNTAPGADRLAASLDAAQPDFHFSPRVAAVSAGVLGVAALAFYVYGHLPGS